MSATRINFQRPIVLTGHSAAVYALCAWEGGFLSGDGDGLLVHWQTHRSEEGRVLAQIPDRVFCIQPLGARQLAVGTLSGDLFWLDLDKPTELPKRWRYHEDGLFGMLVFQDHLYAVGGGGKISKWNIASGEMVQSHQLDTVRLRSIVFLAKAQCLAIGTGNGDVHLIDPKSLRIVDTITQAHELTVFSIVDAGHFFFTAGRDGQLRTWSGKSPFAQLGHVAAHASTINDLSLSFRQNPTNSSQPNCVLASAGRDREIRLWNLDAEPSSEELVLAKALRAGRDGGHPASVNCCLWLAADVLVTGGDDRKVRVWQTADVRSNQ
jgi:WD40 repeat protein